HPGYTLPSRTHFTKLMEQKYDTSLVKVKDALKATENKIALTTDVWTSVATEAYLRITCHFISDDWELTSFCLRPTTMPLEERHTGPNIAAWIEQAVDTFEIPTSKIVAVVHDNDSNVVLTANLQEKNCTGHTLQLVINHAPKNPQISKALGASRSLVDHFKRSGLAASNLKLKQKQMGTPEQELLQRLGLIFRFSTLYLLLDEHLLNECPQNPATQRGKQYLDLKSDQWTLLEELAQALQAFECATVYLSGESYVTVSALPPLVKGLLKSTHTSYETTPVQAFHGAASKETTARWSGEVTFTDDKQSKQIIAAALHPRFLKLKFLTPEERFSFQNKVHALALQHMDRNTGNQDATASAEKGSPNRRTVSVLDSLLGSDSTDSDNSEEDAHNQKIRNEVLMYFGEQPLSKTESPLSWWKSNEARFPALASLAKSFLCIPATSTSSERLFSAAGNIASKKRASLTPEKVKVRVFLVHV
uniref:HAT C-terminal dimerisation domain-containing protein n=1 Tax=Gasterosteus aculeatus TaxID=69293 RepID=G3N6T4_GASAC